MSMITGNYPVAGRRFVAALLTFGYLSLALTPAYASDTEVYTQTVASATGAPMVMLNLDASSSMAKCLTTTADCPEPNRRIDALKRAMRKVLFGNQSEVLVDPDITPIAPAPGNLRVGLALIQSLGSAASEGWKIRHPVRRLDDLLNDGSETVTSTISGGNQDVEQTPLIVSRAEAQLNLGTVSAGVAQSVGLQFAGVVVPRGATISSAYIEFTADTTTTGDPEWNVAIENQDTASDYSSTGPNGRTYSAAIAYNSVPADPSEIDSTTWTANKKYRVSVTSLVQGVVNRPGPYPAGWCGSNAMAFRISNDPLSPNTNQRTAYSFEGAGATLTRAPKLVVTFSMSAANAANTCVVKPFSKTISIGDVLDDVDWYDTTTTVNSGRTDLNVANVNASNQRLNVGLRFPAVEVNNNATLTSAILYMYESVPCGNGNCTLPDLHVSAFTPGAGNLPAFCSGTSCTVPTAGVSSALTWAVGSFKSNMVGNSFSKNVTSLVQPLLQNASWASGNALGFRIRNAGTTSNPGAFYAYQSTQASKAPRLELVGTQILTSLPVTSPRTVREQLMESIDSLVPENNAPGANTYLESARYLLGEEVSTKASSYSDPSTYSISGGRKSYISPISPGTECSGNYLFYMSGGVPDSSAQANLVAPTGIACDTADGTPSGAPLQPWRCSFNTANSMASGLSSINSVVKTNTLVLGNPSDPSSVVDMATLARAGDGTAFNATSEAALLASLQATIAGALDEGASISAPGVAVNQLSRLNHLNQLYYSVFDPDSHAYWRGNVKRYRLGFVAGVPTVFDSGDGTGVGGKPAISDETSFFKENAWSWWSLTADGQRASAGGAADVLPAPDGRDDPPPTVPPTPSTARRMYTHLAANPVTPTASTTALTTVDLSNASFNSAAMAQMGFTTGDAADEAVYKNLMHWLQGYDITYFDGGEVAVSTTTLLRHEMGGALHSRPILVNYGYSGSSADAAANDPSLQDNTVYFSTMEGVFHAIDTSNGIEEFSFIPKEKLSAVNTLARNPVQTVPEFGMDLTWTVLREDANGDFKITTGSGDKVWLFGGMRMGGRNYYALDVTDRGAPKLKWVLEGGASGAFANMGQTWSQPVLGKIKVAGVVKNVLFFGGGYDPKHETAGYSAANNADSLGNQVYIVDADTGALYRWASSDVSSATSTGLSVANLKFSVPSELKKLDSDSDGLVDALYFGDMGGQVFRLDIDNENTAASGLIKRVRLLAEVGQTVTANTSNQRRFFEPPSVAKFLNSVTREFYVMLALGSGYRSHPLNELTSDFLYALRDNDVTRSNLMTLADASLQAVITPADLAVVDPMTVSASGVDMTDKMGWYADLPLDGEKVLASPFIFNNEITFTSYVPTVVDPSPCTPIYGETRLYQLSVFNGALVDFNNDGTINADDRGGAVMKGIGGEAQMMFPGGADASDPSTTPPPGCDSLILVGTTPICGGSLTKGQFKRLRWYNKTLN